MIVGGNLLYSASANPMSSNTAPAAIPMIVGVSFPETGRAGAEDGVGDATASNGVAVGIGVTIAVAVTVGDGVAVGAVVAHVQLESVVQDGFLQTPT